MFMETGMEYLLLLILAGLFVGAACAHQRETEDDPPEEVEETEEAIAKRIFNAVQLYFITEVVPPLKETLKKETLEEEKKAEEWNNLDLASAFKDMKGAAYVKEGLLYINGSVVRAEDIAAIEHNHDYNPDGFSPTSAEVRQGSVSEKWDEYERDPYGYFRYCMSDNRHLFEVDEKRYTVRVTSPYVVKPRSTTFSVVMKGRNTTSVSARSDSQGSSYGSRYGSGSSSHNRGEAQATSTEKTYSIEVDPRIFDKTFKYLTKLMK